MNPFLADDGSRLTAVPELVEGHGSLLNDVQGSSPSAPKDLLLSARKDLLLTAPSFPPGRIFCSLLSARKDLLLPPFRQEGSSDH